MVSVVERNCTWQMATQVCFNTEKIVNHVSGSCGDELLMPFLSAKGGGKRYISCYPVFSKRHTSILRKKNKVKILSSQDYL